MQFARKLVRDFPFFDDVEPSAVNHPNLRRRARGPYGLLFFAQTRIQPGKVIGRTDPHDAGKHVRPAQQEVQPFANRRIDYHRSSIDFSL